MMDVQLASEAAPGRASNEDHAFHVGNLVGVLDGVSVPAGVDTGCVHGPAWYVRRLAYHLQAAPAQPGISLTEGLAAAIAAVHGEHEGRCDLQHPNTPAATVAMVRTADDHLEYLVLCEAHILLDLGGRTEVITDQRFADVVTDIRQAALTGDKAIGAPEHDGRVRQAALTRQQRTNRPGGYWIAAATPEAAYKAVTGQHTLAGPERVRRAVLLTDGASCAVERFALLDWRGLLDLVVKHGPEALIRRIRAAEHADAAGWLQPRYKRHDDASVALCSFGE